MSGGGSKCGAIRHFRNQQTLLLHPARQDRQCVDHVTGTALEQGCELDEKADTPVVSGSRKQDHGGSPGQRIEKIVEIP